MTEHLETAEQLKPGQSIEIKGQKWLVLRVAGGRAEIKRMGLDERVKPLPNRKARRKLWKEIKRMGKNGRVAG